jgi:beta-mannosidase
MEREFKLPSDFGLYVYESQIIAGEIQKYAIEHMRRNRGRCMGVITWQLNDCWPVVSWAGLDYYGRWKAQQYYSKRLFAPILLSANENGTTADIYVTNDTFDRVSGEVEWALKDSKSNVIINGRCDITVEPLMAKNCVQLDFDKLACDFNPNENYLEYTLRSEGKEIGFGTTIFVATKEFVFSDPKISYTLEETANTYKITLEAKAYTRFVALDLETDDCIFSDNFFDMSGKIPRIITVEKSDMSKKLSLAEFEHQLKVVSVYDLQ